MSPIFETAVALKPCVNFVEICNVYLGKMVIKAAKRIFNSDKICRSYSDLNFGVTFFGTQCSSYVVDVSYVMSDRGLGTKLTRKFE